MTSVTNHKYSDQFMNWLQEFGYTHCFFVGGGNNMHLLESASHRFTCIPVVHEVAAGIATEYFNEASPDGARAFTLVTAGPGLTNLITAIGGAWLEDRELLVIGGQAKTTDLGKGLVRQIGHQEIDGTSIVEPISKASFQVNERINKNKVWELVNLSKLGRKGPVFIEMCIDVTASPSDENLDLNFANNSKEEKISEKYIEELSSLIKSSKRPLILIGGAVSRESVNESLPLIKKLGIPIATSFSAMDRIGIEYEFYCGRPNWYGMRSANIILQQSDLLIAIGSRLSIQQTGFRWDEFAPLAKIVQIDVDESYINKWFPRKDLSFIANTSNFFPRLIDEFKLNLGNISEWQDHIKLVKELLAGPDKANVARKGYLELHKFMFDLSEKLLPEDLVIPCSSGGSYTGALQVLQTKQGQISITNMSLASMGYGLSGAIGAAIANPNKRAVLIEGDGGFAQNFQEIGTAVANKLNLKMFVAANEGYASIRTSQQAYFEGHYVGCDTNTGVVLPNWEKIAQAYDIKYFLVDSDNAFSTEFMDLLNEKSIVLFELKLDPQQLYFPKLTSQVMSDGTMKSLPLHLMQPPLKNDVADKVFKYIKVDI
jgi:acetolactate synthase-1/2/3 large subunit